MHVGKEDNGCKVTPSQVTCDRKSIVLVSLTCDRNSLSHHLTPPLKASPPMTVDIRNYLLSAEDLLVESLDSTDSALYDFVDSWAVVVDSLKSLDEPTSELAFATASRVEVLASAFLQIHTEVNTVGASLTSDLDRIFDQLALSDTVGELPRAPAQRMSHLPRSYATPYIAPAFKWLLKNIHNPYPSRQTKELISRGTGTSIQNVDAWFLNARRRIGWTSISKRYYNGSKIDTIAAASRALTSNSATGVADDEEYTPLPANIRMAFVEMEAAAKEMYAEKFTKSELAGSLDRMVKDMTDDVRQRRREEKKKQKALEKLKTELERDDKRSRYAQRRWKEAEEGYPSPSSEPESLTRRFETPSSVGTEDEENISPPLPIAGRRRMPQDLSDEREAVDERPLKRSRILSSSSSCLSADGVPFVSTLEPFPLSPSSTACSTPPPSTPFEDISTSPPSQEASPKRKRRLSDADAEPRPKRPIPLVRPRLQVVSDPLPKSIPSAPLSTSSPSLVDESAALDWSQIFDQQFMAVTDELDTTGPIKMNMFDYSQFADYVSNGETSDGTDWEAQCEPFKSEDPISQSSSPATHAPPLATFTDFDLPPPVSVLPDFELDFCATMGWPFVGTIPSKQASTCSALEDTELNKLDGLSSLASLPPYQSSISSTSEPPRSDEATFDPLGSIDWSSIVPQTIPPTRPVVSTLLNPASIAPVTISPTAYLGGSAESRAGKLRKYQEHLAQARRLEEELAFV
nr:homeodomain mating-type A1 [Pleurotus eryngii]